MTIIEVDGINSEPLAVDSLQIFAGQRYSFVVRNCLSYSLTMHLHSLGIFVARSESVS